MGLVTLTKAAGGLKIELTPEGREELESWSRDDHSDYDMLRMLLEHHLCNGWTEVQPEDVGALTSGMLLSDDVDCDEDGEVVGGGKVYWHDRYAVEDAIESLLAGGLWMRGETVEIGGEDE